MPLLLKGFLPSEMDGSAFISAMKNQMFQPGDKLSIVGTMATSLNFANQASEDRWFVYADGPDATGRASVHMHQSWTGEKAIELRLHIQRSGSSAASSITYILWEPRADIADDDADEREANEVATTVCQWILGVDLGPPAVKSGPAIDPDQMAVVLKNALAKIPRSGPALVMRTGAGPA